MKLSSRIAAAAAVIAAALALPAQAAVTFSVGSSAVLNLDPNQQATLPVFVEFTGADRTTLIADGGLFSGGALLTRQAPGSANSSFITSAVLQTPVFGGGFSETALIGSAPYAAASLYGEITDLGAGALGTDDGTTTRIQLGTFTVNAGPVAGQADTFVLNILDANIDSIVSNAVATALRDPVAFDAQVQPLTISVNVVPEPTVVAVAPLLLAGLVSRRLGRR